MRRRCKPLVDCEPEVSDGDKKTDLTDLTSAEAGRKVSLVNGQKPNRVSGLWGRNSFAHCRGDRLASSHSAHQLHSDSAGRRRVGEQQKAAGAESAATTCAALALRFPGDPAPTPTKGSVVSTTTLISRQPPTRLVRL